MLFLKFPQVYIRIFLMGGSAFGVLVTPLFVWGDGIASGLFIAALCGFLYGIAAAWFGSSNHIGAVLSMKDATPEDVVTIHHQRSIRLILPYEQVFEVCRNVLSSFPGGCKITKSDFGKGILRGRTLTQLSFVVLPKWGVILSLYIKKSDMRTVEVVISARPAFFFVAVDVGASFSAIGIITQRIAEFAKKEFNVTEIIISRS